MAKRSLNIMEKMMDPNIIDYYVINFEIPSIITIENRCQIDFGKLDYVYSETGANLVNILLIFLVMLLVHSLRKDNS